MQPLIRELDVPAAVLRRLAARLPARYPMLLDSAAEGPLSRTSVLLAEPRAALWLDAAGQLGASGTVIQGNTFFTALENWWLAERHATPSPPQTLPFVGGWALFLGYEMAQEVEPRLSLPLSPLPWRAFALRTACALVHDRARDRVFAVAEADAADALQRLEADALSAAQHPDAPAEGFRVSSIEEEDPGAYLDRVRQGKEYVRAGDIYQTNLSRPWRIELDRDPDVAALYYRLCTTNPAPFAALAQWGGVAIVSSSPERLVRVEGRRIDTRPIAGTRPRSLRPGDDMAEMNALAAHPKERAEHIMLIDLERNDLGRVCEPGTVRVDELMTIESYAHVHHIVSNVSGVLRPDVTPIEALKAVFPGGTITGVPKFRCMQIIAELEQAGRGAYTGSLGYLDRHGTMDLNILIRTMTVMGRRIEFRAGAGIVADSDPDRELGETRAKARGLLAAFEVAREP
ncbi:MAG TPA: aminodeoxychorismate synthase component I [Steroidobacteraceae bacterium]|nr:aminodeoxychorismate synthase component I [Steroidobacteraceae bacterium]